MFLLTQWLRSLADAIENDRPIVATHHRVVEPGRQPLHGPGLVRYQAVGPIDRPGQPPEFLSVMSFFLSSSEQRGMINADIARALGAQLTYLLDRRIDVLAETPISMENAPQRLTFLPMSGLPDRTLLAPVDVDHVTLDERLQSHLSILAGLDDDDAEIIGSALDMHYGACLLLDRDLASAYTLLVAGIETLSRRFGEPPHDWNEWDQASEWDQFCKRSALSDNQSAALRSALMQDRQLRLGETFSSYGSSRLPETFWDGEWRDWVCSLTMPDGVFTGGDWSERVTIENLVPKDSLQLKKALKKSYAARSGFVHKGERSVDLTTEIAARAVPGSVARLSFPGLRLVLRGLIDTELQSRSSSKVELPPIIFTLDPPPAST